MVSYRNDIDPRGARQVHDFVWEPLETQAPEISWRRSTFQEWSALRVLLEPHQAVTNGCDEALAQTLTLVLVLCGGL